MKIPKKLKIRRSTWKVEIDETIEETEDAVGLCIPSSRKIVLSPNGTRNEREETFLHELLHACWPDDACGARLEEKIVGELAPVLLKALKDNDIF